MSTGLLSQLDTYYSWIDEAQNPIHPDEVASLIDTPVRELAVPVPANPRQPWLVAVVSAAAVLVLVGGAALLLRVTGSDSPVADSVVPTTVTESTPEPAPTTGTWSRVPHDEAVFGGAGRQGMTSVTVGGPGLVAVGGTDWYGANPPDGAVWTSVDGVTWSRVPHDDTVFGGSSMSSVTAWGSGLVAVGWDGGILDDVPDQNAAVWTSVDGITWSRVPHDEEVFGGAWITNVTPGGPGLVAVGQTEDADADAVVWTSVDGITWSRVPHDEKIFGGPGKQTMWDVVVGGPGLVAVGRDGDEHGWDNSFASAAAVWTSPDGVTWTRVPHDETVFGTTGGAPLMLSVTVGGPGLVAVGAQSPGGPFETPVWTSPDGFTWTRVPDDETVRGIMTAVTAGGPGLVAVGLDLSGSTAVWTSVDGITWSQAPHDDAVFGSYPDWISDVTVGGPGLVAVGGNSDDAAVGGNSDDAAVWVLEAEEE